MSKWVIGKYIRLSDADRDLMKKEGKTESESVSHQKALIQNFVNEHEELKDCEQYEFFDDGFSGTNFDRPSFEKLIEQIKKGKINCVIVKDFSRFGGIIWNGYSPLWECGSFPSTTIMTVWITRVLPAVWMWS